MNKIFILIIFISSIGTKVVAQENNEDNCAIRILNDRTEKEVNNYLHRQSTFINLLVAKDCKFSNDSLFVKNQLIDTISKNEICEKIFQTIDSIIISLDNGISWNLKKGPPIQPKKFYFKMFSKKGREDQEVMDRIHFLAFCSQFDNSNKSPCTVLDTYKVYTQITYEENPILNAVYEIDLKKKPKRFEILELLEIENN